MKEGFRQSMAWLHTWTGLVVGWVLFFVFLTGTMGYIQYEITRWMEPERPLQTGQYLAVESQIDKAYTWLKDNPDAAQAERWGMQLATGQRGQENLYVNWTMPAKEGESYGQYQRENLDPLTGQLQDAQHKPRETGGGGSLYYMHYALHYIPYQWAISIVGICTMFMFIAIITGVITHKKIFKDFFTFRNAKGQRSWLDGHNVLSVIALPFHIVITYSGLVFFLTTYMPFGVPLIYGQGSEKEQLFYKELYPEYYSDTEHADSKAKAMQSVAPTNHQILNAYHQAEAVWGKGKVSGINIQSATQYSPVIIQVNEGNGQSISRSKQNLSYLVLDNGQIKPQQPVQKPAVRTFSDAILGLHEGLFATAFLRWMYVITGFVGTAMIATGLILWTVKRRPKQIKAGKMSFGHALVEHLNIGLVAGLPLGIAVYFWSNRLLPVVMENRAAWEINTIFITLLAVFIYSWLRPIARAWFEVLILTSIALLLLPVLNALTSDKNIVITAIHKDWVLFSIDLGFILTGLLFAWLSYAVWRKRDAILKAPVKKHAKTAVKPKKEASEIQSTQSEQSSGEDI